jgi:hypothetical protein
MSDATLVSSERIDRAIILLRGQKVILDSELAVLYGVETRVLLQSVRRNIVRFPPDFMFQLTVEEVERSRSQIVILNGGGAPTAPSPEGHEAPKRGHNIKYLPYAFTQSCGLSFAFGRCSGQTPISAGRSSRSRRNTMPSSRSSSMPSAGSWSRLESRRAVSVSARIDRETGSYLTRRNRTAKRGAPSRGRNVSNEASIRQPAGRSVSPIGVEESA